jgi:RNA-directed DNA polymerase
VVDLDLEKFFDRVNHDKLMGQIAKRVEDRRLLKLMRAFLNAGVMENGLVSPSVEGTPQGGPLSPLLSNLVLDELDRELERRGHRFVRYADDCNIYVRSERAGQRVMESISRFITQKLKLKVNEAKSAVARPQERKFLGFSFTAGPDIKRTIAPQSLERFKQRIREITRRAKGVSMKATMEELASYMRGWRGYFGFCETPEVLIALTRRVRLRLRAALWRQWKTPRRRHAVARHPTTSMRRLGRVLLGELDPICLYCDPLPIVGKIVQDLKGAIEPRLCNLSLLDSKSIVGDGTPPLPCRDCRKHQ